MEDPRSTVAVLIPVYRPDEKINELFSLLKSQTYPVDQLIIMETLDEGCDVQEFADKGLKAEVYPIAKKDFDHAGTRRLGMEYVRTDICVCMTQDAYPADEHLIEMLMKGLKKKGPKGERCAAAYARQLPREDCSLTERYTRSFNYPKKSSVKTAADTEELGIKTYFCSNVCAAYDMEIYRELGGFGQHEIFNEDMIYAAHAIKAGYAIVYVAGARVIHSHNYTLSQQFHRNFDLAVSQAMHPEIFLEVSSESEGIRLVKDTTCYLLHKKKPWLIPGLFAQSASKYLGYRLGLMYKRLPRPLILKFTDNEDYWN